MSMECNLISLPTAIVALPTLPTLMTLVAGGVGLGKPGCNLRGGAGNHEQGERDQLHCLFLLSLSFTFQTGVQDFQAWVQLIKHLVQLGSKVVHYKTNLPLRWVAHRKPLFAFSGECWVIPWRWAPHRKGLVAFLGRMRLEKAKRIVGLKYQRQL